MKKIFLYTLALRAHGTLRTAKSLEAIGLPGGHEWVGCANCGSVHYVPRHARVLRVPRGFVPNVHDDYFNGDNRIAAFWSRWRHSGYHVSLLDEGIALFDEVLRVYIPEQETRPVFDSSTFLGEFWPIIDHIPWIDARAVHLTRNPYRWVQKSISVGGFDDTSPRNGGHYGRIGAYEYKYPELRMGQRTERPMLRAFRYWTEQHAFFDTRPNTLRVRTEEFNRPGTARAVIDALWPEADEKTRDAFSLDGPRSRYFGFQSTGELKRSSEAKHPKDYTNDERTHILRIAGDAMRAYGYDPDEVHDKEPICPTKK